MRRALSGETNLRYSRSSFQTAQQHVDALIEQIKPFEYEISLNERVDSISEESNENNITRWRVATSDGQEFITKNIFIAAGAGSFEPRRPPNIENPDALMENGVSYAVQSKKRYENKDVIIFGGGDSALDWTVELADIAKSISWFTDVMPFVVPSILKLK